MNDLDYFLYEAELDDTARVAHYHSTTASDSTERVEVVALTAGDLTLVASIGCTPSGPFVDVFGFDAGNKAVALADSALGNHVSVCFH